MKVKCFDESSEIDLEGKINNFINETACDIIDIKYSVAISMFAEDQIYCFSALVLYSPIRE